MKATTPLPPFYKALLLAGTVLCLPLILSTSRVTAASAEDGYSPNMRKKPRAHRGLKSSKSSKAPKVHKGLKSMGPKSPKSASAACTRETYSVVSPNTEWTDHPFHPQVWYHSLEDIHGLWQEGYFDYVLDIRPLQDFTIDNNGSPLLLEGWETFHIPGSFPINVFPPDTPAEDVNMLVDFTSTNVCKDSRIFVHCWSGISGNRVSKTLIELGFTNVHAAGPQGSAGIWDWMSAGYDVVHDDTFDAAKPELKPACMEACGSA